MSNRVGTVYCMSNRVADDTVQPDISSTLSSAPIVSCFATVVKKKHKKNIKKNNEQKTTNRRKSESMGNMADGCLLRWIWALQVTIPMSTRTRTYAFPDDAEHNSNNKSFGIVYDNSFLCVMLLAHTELYDNMASSQRNYVCRLFDQRQAWKLGTIFTATHCNTLYMCINICLLLQQIESMNVSCLKYE